MRILYFGLKMIIAVKISRNLIARFRDTRKNREINLPAKHFYFTVNQLVLMIMAFCKCCLVIIVFSDLTQLAL